MTMRHVLLALAGLGLAGACASDNEPQDASDENREMQSEAGGEPFGSANLVAAPLEPVAPAEPAPPPSPEEVERTRLCEGIAQPASCPIAAGSVQRVQNIDGGVVMLMRADPTTPMDLEQVQRRIRCFDAASTERDAGSDCIFSLPGANSEVSEDAGKVRVRVLTTEASQLRALRNGARALARRVGGTAHGSTPAETTMSGDEPGGDVRGNGAQTGSPASTGNDVGTGAQTGAEPSSTPR